MSCYTSNVRCGGMYPRLRWQRILPSAADRVWPSRSSTSISSRHIEGRLPARFFTVVMAMVFGGGVLVTVADAQSPPRNARDAAEQVGQGSSGGPGMGSAPPAGSSSGYGGSSGPPTGSGSSGYGGSSAPPAGSGSGYGGSSGPPMGSGSSGYGGSSGPPSGSGSGYGGSGPPMGSGPGSGSGSGYGNEMGMQSYGGSQGMSYGGNRRGGAASGALGARVSAFAMALQGANLTSLADPAAAPPVASGPVLLNEATVAYAKGDQRLALELFFGHIVAEYENAGNAMRLVKYSRLMKRPAWQVRWGISFAVRGDATDPQPIPDVTPQSRGGGGGGEQMGMEMAMGGPGGTGEDDMRMQMEMERQMEMEMSREMNMQMEQEQMGMDMEMEMGMGMGGRGMGNQRNQAPSAPPTPGARLASLERKMLDDEAQQRMSDTLGVLATIIGEEFDKRYAQGDFGRSLTDVTADSGVKETVSADFVDLLETGGDPLPLWRPGIVFLGEGSSQDNLAVARKAGLDLVIHIDVLLKPLQGEYVQNNARCRLFHVPSGKSMGLSKPVDSLEYAQQSRTKGLASRDYVNDQLANFWGIIDRETLTSELPPLTPEVAKRRVGALLSSGGGKNLRTLAEVRLFQSQQLLSEDEVLTAFDIVGGEEALALIYGSEEERLDTVRKWAAPRSSGDAAE